MAGTRRSVPLVGLAFSVFAVCIGSTSTSDAHVRPNAAQVSSEQASPQVLHTRAEFGLPVDPTTLNLAAKQSTPTSNALLGIPLTTEEAHNIAQRFDVASLLGHFIDVYGADPTFGGVEINQADGGNVLLFITNPASTLPGVLADILGSEASLKTTLVAQSYSALDKQFRGIDPQDPRLSSAGIDLTTVDIDLDQNSVRLTVTSAPSDSQIALLDSLAVNPEIVVNGAPITPTESRYSTGTPVYGGRSIQNVTDGMGCTANIEGINSTGSRYAITAGHCETASGKFYGTGPDSSGPGLRGFGTSHANLFRGVTKTDCDCTFILLRDQSESVTASILGGGPTSAAQPVLTLSRTGTDGDDKVKGAPVNSSGKNSGYIAGTLTGAVETSYDGVTVVGYGTTLDTRGGDSGGPVTQGSTHTWLGVINAGFGNGPVLTNMIFSGGFAALSRTGIVPAY